jgi:hypothetical protein
MEKKKGKMQDKKVERGKKEENGERKRENTK